MLYVLGDVDDEQRHRQNCTKIRDGPVLPSLKGLKTVVEVEDTRGYKGIIVEVRQVAGKGFPDSVTHALGHVHKELGASDDEVPPRRSFTTLRAFVSLLTRAALPCCSRSTPAASWHTCMFYKQRGQS